MITSDEHVLDWLVSFIALTPNCQPYFRAGILREGMREGLDDEGLDGTLQPLESLEVRFSWDGT
jgi:hypothetical protein